MSDPTMMRHLADEEKPREKAIAEGTGALTDAQLLAIMLRTGVQGRNVIRVAEDILREYDNDLSRLAKATAPEMARLVPGIGTAKAITVLAGMELGIRAQKAAALAQQKQQRMTSSKFIYDYMKSKMELLTHEEFWVLMLNQRLGVIGARRVSIGGVTSTLVDVKILFKYALDAQCPAIVLLHNHPSGALNPSTADDELTRKICSGAKVLDIRVIDHIIVTPGSYYSYADNGHLPL